MLFAGDEVNADWVSIVRSVLAWVEEQADTHLDESADGRLVMPSVDVVFEEAGRREVAKQLVTAACKADPRIADAIGTACANAKGVDHDVLRELVALLPAK